MPPRTLAYSHDDIHRALQQLATQIQQSAVAYHAIIAIGGGGFIPARILRTFLNVPIYAVSTAYYLNDQSDAKANTIQKIQWLDPMPESLIGQNILVVDEVDDSRVTAEFVLRELQNSQQFRRIGFAVIHNKNKAKQGVIPQDIDYFAALQVADEWIAYPWDALDIDAHNHNAAQRRD